MPEQATELRSGWVVVRLPRVVVRVVVDAVAERRYVCNANDRSSNYSPEYGAEYTRRR